MSLEYWPIVGYGIMVSDDMVDFEKAVRLMKAYGIEPDPEPSLEDGLQFLTELSEDVPIYWESTCDMYDECFYYLYVPAVLPWEVSSWQHITRDRTNAVLKQLVGLILRNGVEAPSSGEIADVGCG